jgi:predicted acyl esterase
MSYYARNREARLAYQREYRQRNRERILQKSRDLDERNREKARERWRLYRRNNPHVGQAWLTKNKGRRDAYKKEYRLRNADAITIARKLSVSMTEARRLIHSGETPVPHDRAEGVRQ